MEDLGIDPQRRPSQGSKIAAIVNETEMFKPRFKIHSKIVHPTALSIAATTTPNSLDALMPLISSEASAGQGCRKHLIACCFLGLLRIGNGKRYDPIGSARRAKLDLCATRRGRGAFDWGV